MRVLREWDNLIDQPQLARHTEVDDEEKRRTCTKSDEDELAVGFSADVLADERALEVGQDSGWLHILFAFGF